MSIHKSSAKVISQTQLLDDVFDLVLESVDISRVAKPGQFVSVFCKDGSRLLPRPISICEIRGGTLRLVYRIAGKGTEEFCGLEVGQTVDIMGPLGNGFMLRDKPAIIIGGGIGIPPMLELAKELKCKRQIVLGYRDELFLNDEFKSYGDVYISTEDGSNGVKGNVIDAIGEYKLSGEVIYACGPTLMLKGIKEYAENNGIEAQLSLEERMACGIGACLACVCKSKDVDVYTNVKNKRVCKDGPIFLAEEVEL